MRLHHLRVTAFGPFAGAEEVDFDELCDAGLFLLTGPTGAGKTTILDAVCFALYGSVPGVRGVKALKSQHAPDDARPEVELDFSVRGRRFVVRRSPEWTRPKRRGTGFTTENARATLIETTSGEEHLLSSRAQEVGHFVGELVGMQSTQFVQVAMLPQGDFQKFLRASSQERHEVLQHLFRTDRFSRIEDWVHEHSRALAQRSSEGQGAVVRVLDTVAERCGTECPEEISGEGLFSAEAQQQALGWVAGLVDSAGSAYTSARERHRETEAAAAAARARHHEALRISAVIVRRDQARATLADLEQDRDTTEQARRRIAADDRAGRCLPLLGMLDTATADLERAAALWQEARERTESLELGDLALPSPVTVDTLNALEQEVRTRSTRLEALLPREAELTAHRRDLTEVDAALGEATQSHGAATARLDTLPADVATARSRVASLTAAAGRSEALTVELEHARRRVEAAQAAERCAESLVELQDAERAARDQAADAKDHVQELTARRLAGIAAELAGQLERGEACQVCGSRDHPHPAQPSDDAVTEAEQADAQAAYDVLHAAHAATSGNVLRAQERLEALRASAEHLSVSDAAARADELAAALHEAQQAQAALVAAEESVTGLLREQEELTHTAHELATRIATLTQSATTHRRAIESLSSEIAVALGRDTTSDGLQVSLTEEAARLSRQAASLSTAREALCDHEAAVSHVSDLEEHARVSAIEHGFDDVTSLRAAVLDEDERGSLEGLLDARDRAAARARTVLEEPEVHDLEAETAPDVDALGVALALAEEQEAAAAKAEHQREEVVEALGRLQGRLGEALSAWAPVREEFRRADAMSKLVRGMGADNQLQMRLSAYVLATRLDQVVDAANERLAHMRDQRYLLQRTGRAARKGSQAGLGLEVVDQWTGDVRAPTTLSGGETFVVSLALALGLADVVTYEAGGTEIETLFVDEGFGTLDADTLDDVMDRLDDLRAGGRAVGVVSHVSEMRNRIPTQLHVEKQRHGSTVRVRTAVG
jgi:DNA repair protein SbcC/Rad50